MRFRVGVLASVVLAACPDEELREGADAGPGSGMPTTADEGSESESSASPTSAATQPTTSPSTSASGPSSGPEPSESSANPSSSGGSDTDNGLLQETEGVRFVSFGDAGEGNE